MDLFSKKLIRKRINKTKGLKMNKVKFKINSLKTTILILVILSVSLPSSLIGFISIRSASNTIEEKIKHSLKDSVNQTGNMLDKVISDGLLSIPSYIYESSVQVLISGKYKNLSEFDRSEAVNVASKRLANMSMSNKTINFIGFVLPNGDITSYPKDKIFDKDRVLNGDWYKRVVESHGDVIYLDEEKEGEILCGESVGDLVDKTEFEKGLTLDIIVAKNIDQTMGVTKGTIMVMSFDGEYISNTLGKLRFTDHAEAMAITPSKMLITSEGRSETRTYATETYLADIDSILSNNPKEIAGVITTEIEGKKYFIGYAKGAQKGWYYITKVPYSDFLGDINSIENQVILYTFIFIFIAVCISSFVVLRMVGAIQKLKDSMIKFEKGNLNTTIDIKRKDEIGDLAETFNNMSANIKQLVTDILMSSDSVLANTDVIQKGTDISMKISEEIACAIQQISTGAYDQTNALGNTNKLVDDLSNKIQEMVNFAQGVNEASTNAKESSINGTTAIRDLQKKSDDTAINLEEVQRIIVELQSNSQNIGDIVNTIKHIAEETNLLSLNASIEAARAGSAGQGFAVVAGEVRKLSGQTSESAQEINAIIETIQKYIQQTVDVMTILIESFAQQSESVGNTLQGFKRIVKSIENIESQMSKLNDSVHSIDIFKGEILADVQGVSAISEESAACTEQISSTTESQKEIIFNLAENVNELKKVANTLKESASQFQIK